MFFGTARLAGGERIDYTLPLSGERPSLEFTWVDSLGHAGTVALRARQLPRPMPSAENRLCSIRVEPTHSTPGWVDGVVVSTCASTVKEALELQPVTGHREETLTGILAAAVVSISGTVAVEVSDGASSSVAEILFMPGDETRFSVPISDERGVRNVTLRVDLTASLQVDLPPLTVLTHHEERDEEFSKTVSLTWPAWTETVERTVEVTHPDGSVTQQVVSVEVTILSRSVSREAVFRVFHEEHVRAGAACLLHDFALGRRSCGTNRRGQARRIRGDGR